MNDTPITLTDEPVTIDPYAVITVAMFVAEQSDEPVEDWLS